MSDSTNAKRGFLPWVRYGLATSLPATDTLGAGVAGRVDVPVTLWVNDPTRTSDSRKVQVPVRFYGPGDITGIDPREVVRTDPGHLVTDFEPNYFPSIEFDLPGFHCLFTPARADASGKLRPWLCLVAVAKQSGASLSHAPVRPLPVLECPLKELPDLRDSWAWAHAQVTRNPQASAGQSVDSVLRDSPERTVSRLICPRRLEPNTAYFACVVPTFEAGRKAGLGEPVTAEDERELRPAWVAGTSGADEKVRLPVYYHWEFSTGAAGDFEALVRRLEPRSTTAGLLRVDVSAPGWTMPAVSPNAPGAILEMEGALRTPDTRPAPWPDEARRAFQQKLRTILNPPEQPSTTAGPLVTPPIYGQEYARERAVPADNAQPHWLRELNLDPRYRAAAGLGAMVVRYEQEQLMASAWQQLAAHNRNNEDLRRKQFRYEIGKALWAKHFEPSHTERLLQITQPALDSIINAQRTPLSPEGRARGGELQKAGPREVSIEAVALSESMGSAVEAGNGWEPAESALHESLRQAVHEPTLDAAFRRLTRLRGPFARRLLQDAELSMNGDGAARKDTAGGGVPVLPAAENTLPGAETTTALPQTGSGAHAMRTIGGAMSVAARMVFIGEAQERTAAVPEQSLAGSTPREAEPLPGFVPLPPEETGLGELRDLLLEQLNPSRTILESVQSEIAGAESIDPVPFTPVFEQPMYETLRGYFLEWLLPGLEDVPPNTIATLFTNPRFIEAFMVGLNHEMSRELLWRGYLADHRGTYFRQFWDAPGNASGTGSGQAPSSALPPIASWPRDSSLGGHLSESPEVFAIINLQTLHFAQCLLDFQKSFVQKLLVIHLAAGSSQGQLVLLIRGDLLRRYSRAVIYAVEAAWQDGKRVLGKAERYPLFRGTSGTDVTFLGFALTEDDARGSTNPAGHPGWFFVVQEPLTEPRFGLDIATTFGGRPASWNDVSWGHLVPDETALGRLTYVPVDGPLKDVEIGGVRWGANGAHMAMISQQPAFRIAIHASAWLPKRS